jgi:hypothetical protein
MGAQLLSAHAVTSRQTTKERTTWSPSSSGQSQSHPWPSLLATGGAIAGCAADPTGGRLPPDPSRPRRAASRHWHTRAMPLACQPWARVPGRRRRIASRDEPPGGSGARPVWFRRPQPKFLFFHSTTLHILQHPSITNTRDCGISRACSKASLSPSAKSRRLRPC